MSFYKIGLQFHSFTKIYRINSLKAVYKRLKSNFRNKIRKAIQVKKNPNFRFFFFRRSRAPICLFNRRLFRVEPFGKMATNEPDQDVIRWGLNLLDVGPFFNSNYGCGCNQDCNHDGSIYHDQYMRGYNYDTSCNSDCNYVKNDALNVHNLQEEFSQFQVGDTIQPTHEEPHHFQQSDWLLPSSINYCAAHENAQEANDTGHSSSCSSPGERSNDGEDYSYSLEFVDDSTLDGELGRRLNQMVPVPHVPRINGEIPSMDEATTDHQRLLDRLQLYDLVERKIQGDGNCQFRALADQFYRTPEHHKFVRQQVVSQLKAQSEFYEGYVPMEYGEYLKKMSRSGEWGDHVTLQAAADSYGVKIFLMTSFKDTCYMEIIPKIQKSKRIIFLSFWAEVHYNSIYPQGDLPPSDETKRKKKWWRFGSN